MKIWLVTVGEPLPLPGSKDKLLRTGRLAAHLRRNGHAVVWWSSTFDHIRKAHHPVSIGQDVELEDGTELRLLHGPSYRSNVSLARLLNHHVVARAFEHRAKASHSPDVILCSYPTIELSAASLRYATTSGCKVILDVRDLWPDIFSDGLPRIVRPLARPLIEAYDRIARRSFELADGIVGVSEGYLDWGLRKARRPRSPARDAVIPIGFERPTVPDHETAVALGQLGARGIRFDRVLAVFAGTFGRTYDLATVLRAAARLESSAPMLQFVLAGDGENGARWRERAKGLSNVVMPGWLERNQLAALYSRASIGLQAYAPGAPQGLANKLFEYLGYGMCLVSSLSGENAALIEEHSCGVNYRAGDSADLAEALEKLLLPGAHLESSRRNSLMLFEREYSQRAIHGQYLAYLEQFASNPADTVHAPVRTTS